MEDCRGICHRHVLPIVSLLLASLTHGIAFGAIGPALPDIQYLTNTTTPQVATIFTWRGIAEVLGSLVLGPLVDTRDAMALLAIFAAMSGLFMTLLPWCPDISGVSVLTAFDALFCSGLVAAMYMLPFQRFLQYADTIIQAVFVCFNLGLAIAPILVSPFLSDILHENPAQNNSQTGAVEVDIKVQWAFLTTGISLWIAALFCGLSYFTGKSSSYYTSLGEKRSKDIFSSVQEAMDFVRQQKQISLFILLVFLMVILLAGIDMLISSLLVTFTEQWLHWSVGGSTLLASIYPFTKVIFGLIFVPAASRVPTSAILLFDCVITLLGTILFLLFYNTNDVMVWVSICVIAAGISNCNATGFSFVQEITPISGKISSLSNIAYCIALFLSPPISALLMDQYGAVAFPSMMLIFGAMLVVFSIIVVRYKQVLRRKSKEEYSEGEVPEQNS